MSRLHDFDAIDNEVDNDSKPDEALVNTIARILFRKDCLDRRLKRHHITGKRSSIHLKVRH